MRALLIFSCSIRSALALTVETPRLGTGLSNRYKSTRFVLDNFLIRPKLFKPYLESWPTPWA